MAAQVVKEPQIVEQLALAAYQNQAIPLAEHWLKLAPKDSLLVQWLQAKLHLKHGHSAKALAILARVAPHFPAEGGSNHTPASPLENIRMTRGPGREVRKQVHGELGMLYMARRDYARALEIFIENDLFSDATYVAERVLTITELQNFVDSSYPAQPELPPGQDLVEHQQQARHRTELLRRLTACRLARDSQFDATRPYFRGQELSVLDRFLEFSKAAEDASNPPEDRARNFWDAARLVKDEGYVLFDQPMEPWWRRSSNYDEAGVWPDEEDKPRLAVPSPDELRRVEAHRPAAHYFELRHLAADLAWNAAELLPDNSEQTASILHTAGTWIKYLDPEAADKFYKALVIRCRTTELGWAADIKRWFPVLGSDGNIVYPLRDGGDSSAFMSAEPELIPAMFETPPDIEESLLTEDEHGE